MALSLIFLMSLVAVVAALVTLVRILGWRRVLKHATLIDIGFTLVICFALAGTLTGLLIGIVAGLVMTGTLTCLRFLQARLDDVRAATARTAQPEDNIYPGGCARHLTCNCGG